GLAGILAADLVSTELRNTKVIAITTLLFGLLLGYADRRGSGDAGLSWRKVLWIGMAQALAVVPGTSRSGVTMTAALLCGLGRREAARFSFLLSIPIIAVAGLLQAVELSSNAVAVEWSLLLLATLLSALTAYLCVRWFIALIERVGFMPFLLYRVVLGLLLIWTGW
ncbi:MAG: undecaprenyl-diphosphatase, partial [Halieaceae bacterium]|nr:undecaprenyl-diphosphatase [Halieaceae bacterium]